MSGNLPAHFTKVVARLAVLRELGAGFSGTLDPHHNDETAWYSGDVSQLLGNLNDDEKTTLKDAISYSVQHPNAALTLHLLVGLQVLQTQHHVGTKRLTMSMATAIKVTTGTSNDFDAKLIAAGHPVYAALHDVLHSHDTRSELVTVAAPLAHHVCSFPVFSSPCIFAQFDGLMLVRAPGDL